MPSERELVYKLDEGMALGGAPEKLYIILCNDLSGRGFRPENLFRFGCSQGTSFVKLTVDWAEWNRQVHSNAGYCRIAFDSALVGGNEAQSPDGQVYEGSYTPGPSGSSEVDYSGKRIGESVFEGKIQRGHGPLYDGPSRLSPCENSYQVGWQHGYTAARVLCNGGLD